MMAENGIETGAPDASDMHAKKRLQGKLIELEYLKAQADGIQQQLKMVSESLAELNSAGSALDVLSKLKAGDDLLVPVGSGTFVKAKLASSGTVISGIGAGVLAEKTMDETKKSIDEQIEKLTTAAEQMRDALEKMGAHMQSSALEVQQALAKEKAKQNKK